MHLTQLGCEGKRVDRLDGGAGDQLGSFGSAAGRRMRPTNRHTTPVVRTRNDRQTEP